MSLWSNLFSSGSKEARAEAVRRGVEISAVERETPIFHHLRRQFSHLKRLTCVCYSVRRRNVGTPERWSFLQRDQATGAQYPNGWMYASSDGPPSARLHALLATIAEDWREEYLEFDADADRIRAYWDEWGGAEMAAQVDTWLRALEAASAAA